VGELEKQAGEGRCEIGLLVEQLEMVDVMFSRRTDEEKEQDVKSKQALDMAKMAMARSEIPSDALFTL
jgi:hypothetical protein